MNEILNDIKELKTYAIHGQRYELAAFIRDMEKRLMESNEIPYCIRDDYYTNETNELEEKNPPLKEFFYKWDTKRIKENRVKVINDLLK